jgi:hypothetical protein
MLMNGVYYLNNHGSRWIVLINGIKEKREFTTKSGRKITRTVIEYKNWGNFGTALISYKGKKIRVFADSILDD